MNVFPSAVENLVRQFEAVDEFRVQVTKRQEMAELKIELECADGTDAEVTRHAILQQFQNVLGLQPDITDRGRPLSGAIMGGGSSSVATSFFCASCTAAHVGQGGHFVGAVA